MTRQYSVLEFDSYSEKFAEPMGTKTKYWVEQHTTSTTIEWLFKIPRKDTGEHWAEKAAWELARLIELPAAQVELATLVLEDELLHGTASKTFTPGNLSLIHGNELLERIVPGYDKEKRFSQREHRISAIFDAIVEFELAEAPTSSGMSAVECFVGYIVFDGWIANVDRHHENWGMLADSIDRIAPSYDHASSLGRLLSDEKRTRILEGRDRLDVINFLTRGKASGAIYPVAGEKSVPPWKLVTDLSQMGYATVVNNWLRKIQEVTPTQLGLMFSAFGPDWLSEPARRFATEILKTTPQLMQRAMSK